MPRSTTCDSPKNSKGLFQEQEKIFLQIFRIFGVDDGFHEFLTIGRGQSVIKLVNFFRDKLFSF